MEKDALLRRIRIWLGVFIACLVLSGLTAFPLERELELVNHLLGIVGALPLLLCVRICGGLRD